MTDTLQICNVSVTLGTGRWCYLYIQHPITSETGGDTSKLLLEKQTVISNTDSAPDTVQ